MPRFVLLYHDCPPHYPRPSHWDFMLEAGDSLRTWALEKLPREWHVAHARTVESFPQCPALADGNEVAAEKLGDHRRDYLEFEGGLTNDRGRVVRVAEGSFIEQWETPLGWFLSLKSEAMNCAIELDQSDKDSTRWTLSIRN